MPPHVHMSIHGVVAVPATIDDEHCGPRARSGEHLPALAPRRSAVPALGGADHVHMGSDQTRDPQVNEYQWGVDPEPYLRSVGVRPAASA